MSVRQHTSAPFILHPDNTWFPDVGLALKDPDGLLAIGGDLSPQRLVAAYAQGIFPWYNDDQPILWWSPDPRTVLFPKNLSVSRSLRKTLNKNIFQVSLDRAFDQVIRLCAEPRSQNTGTWLTPDMQLAYCRLHELGYAHSVESWQDGKLVGGLYGVAIGKVFFGESMFTRQSDASKVALVHLANTLKERGFEIIDCQMYTPHLISLGAEEIPREEFMDILNAPCEAPCPPGKWTTT